MEEKNEIFDGEGFKSIKAKVDRSVRYLDATNDEELSSPDYILEYVRPALGDFVRGIRKKHDNITDKLDKTDKASPSYDKLSRKRESLANSLVMARSQLTSLNTGTLGMKRAMGSLNKGTQSANLYGNSVVYGAQSDNVKFDDEGKMTFASMIGSGPNDISTFNLDDMGEFGLITEPVGSKAFVWKLAEKTKQDAISGKEFDGDWAYTRIFNDLTKRGPHNSIGMAFADLAGDNQTKSFAEQYEDGLVDPMYYTHPETGEALPQDSSWMKDPKNADLLKKFLGRYIVNVMKEVHGPTINEKTGQVKKTQADRVQELIKKYRK